MKRIIIAAALSLLTACSGANFIADAPPVPVTSQVPDHFELPARFALVRLVYNQPEPAGFDETALWDALAERSASLGQFSALQIGRRSNGSPLEHYLNTARQQRFNYMIVTSMDPNTGSAQVSLYDVGSGGLMATSDAVTERGGQRGFWGGSIRNPARLERATLRIARAVLPEIEELLQGVVDRQR